MFFDLFVTKSQVHSYGPRTASSSCYRSHHRCKNLKQFTILIIKVLQFGILCHTIICHWFNKFPQLQGKDDLMK